MTYPDEDKDKDKDKDEMTEQYPDADRSRQSKKEQDGWPTITDVTGKDLKYPPASKNVPTIWVSVALCIGCGFLQKRKVLKSNLHCNCKIFISSGNSSGPDPTSWLPN